MTFFRNVILINEKNHFVKDIELINGLLSNNKKAIDYIYEHFFNRIKYYIQNKGGGIDDAKDVFQEALIVIYKKAKEDTLELKSQFFTYLMGVCKYIWLNVRKKKSNNTVTLKYEDTLKLKDSSVEQRIIEQERYSVYEENFKKLGDLCQKVLQLFFKRKSMEEIAKAIGYETAHSVRTKKYKCQQQLKKLIHEDKKFIDFNFQ